MEIFVNAHTGDSEQKEVTIPMNTSSGHTSIPSEKIFYLKGLKRSQDGWSKPSKKQVEKTIEQFIHGLHKPGPKMKPEKIREALYGVVKKK